MATSLACLQARIDTFAAPATSKSRRTSSRSKKAPSKAKNAWPLAAPSAHDLAFAGFVWKPTTASPDNVQCFSCHCQLDGWEEADVPAYEHLTHSPSCGFAVVTCIRLRTGDPGRSEDDPVNDAMMQARRDTFGESWPLDSNEGFPSVEQMVEAGWYYDPTLDTPDGATCAYCSLSLDAWDAGDDPMEEHRRRAPDCLFFALKELYHPAPEPAPRKDKRASARTSNASTTSKTRGKKRASEQIDDTIGSIKDKPTRRNKRASEQIDTTIDHAGEKPTRGKKPTSEQSDDAIDMLEEEPAPAPRPKAKKAAPKAKRASTRTSTASTTTKSRSKKRTSDQIDETEVAETTPKRMRYSSMSSLPDSLLVGTPKRTPRELAEPKPMQVEPAEAEPAEVESAEAEMMDMEADISSLPASLLVGTPKKTPPRMMDTGELQQLDNWEPIDIDTFFSNTEEVQGFINDVVVDAGLDAIMAAGAKTEEVQAAVMAGLTKSEKDMSVEQWVLYNAKRGEEKLRQACEKQILAFEAQARRARVSIESLPTY